MPLNVALAQVNLFVGDIQANTEKIIRTACYARDQLNADAVVFPELSVTAYPPEDLLLRADFIAAANQAVMEIASKTNAIVVILGFPEAEGNKLFNSAVVLRNGDIETIYRKNILPNYGVFDEQRYFTAGKEACVFELKGVSVGLSICEDIWESGVVGNARQAGAEILFNLNASPFHAAKIHEREDVVRQRVKATSMPVVYVNQVGGQDELVFDGASFVMNKKGEIVFRAKEFDEQVSVIGFNGIEPEKKAIAAHYNVISSEYNALVLGIRDYVNKNGFKGALLGLSGGIDSALVLALAVDALGSDQVEAVLMPSRYTQDMSNKDAILEAKALGVQ